MPVKKATAPPAPTEDDYIIFTDGRTMPMPVWEQVPEWLTPMRLRKPVGLATAIDESRGKGKRGPAQRRAG